MKNPSEVQNRIVDWLKNYAENANAKGFVIGISGGIDSAVTSMLCTLTGLPVVCVEMPIHQDQLQVRRGKEHIEMLKTLYLNVTSIEVDLTQTFDTMENDLSASLGKCDNWELTLANTRARLRMTTLYAVAGVNNYLVAGTGNKVEDFGVGFYTKYGDGGVDLSPIGDLMKSEVRTLAMYMGIGSMIITAAPTDGLFGDSRTDEQQLGATYDELEWAMNAEEKGVQLNTFTERQKEVYQIYKNRNRVNQHKMKPIPVCLIN